MSAVPTGGATATISPPALPTRATWGDRFTLNQEEPKPTGGISGTIFGRKINTQGWGTSPFGGR